MSALPAMRSYFEYPLMLSLEAPEDWEVAASEDYELVLFGPVEEHYRATIGFNIVRLDPPQLENFEGLIKQTGQNQAKNYPGYKLLGDERFLLDDCEAFVRRFEVYDQEHAVKLSLLQAFILTGPKTLYVVDGSSLKSLEAKYLSVLEHILRSLRFIPATSTR